MVGFSLYKRVYADVAALSRLLTYLTLATCALLTEDESVLELSVTIRREDKCIVCKVIII